MGRWLRLLRILSICLAPLPAMAGEESDADVWDSLKRVSLGAPEAFVSIGGQVRARYEYFRNVSWGAGPEDDDGYLLQRTMVHTDAQLGRSVRAFFELKSGVEVGRSGGPRPPDEDEVDVHQGFIEVSGSFGALSRVAIRAGRQELAFGSSRLVSVREGPNVRQSFDGARLTLAGSRASVDLFLTRPVETDRGVFDDGPDQSRAFWGAYGVVAVPIEGYGFDLYYLGLDSESADFDQGSAHEHRHSVGTRLWGKTRGWDSNLEAVFQWGSFGTGAIRAWTAAADNGYTFADAPFAPRLGLKANIASGDRDPDDRDLETFNALFPRGAYFSEAGLLGPANFFDVHPSLALSFTSTFSVTADWDFFWRQSRRDAIYGNAANVVRSAGESRARRVGDQVSLDFSWDVDRHLEVHAYYGHFFAGPFLEETSPGRDVDFVGTWATYRF